MEEGLEDAKREQFSEEARLVQARIDLLRGKVKREQEKLEQLREEARLVQTRRVQARIALLREEELEGKEVGTALLILDVNYPKLTLNEAKDQLKEFYPAWLLTREGMVIGANLMAIWLWNIPQLDILFSSNAATIFSSNFNRIPKEQNNEFYSKKAAVMKRVIARFGIDAYLPYIDGLRNDPDLWNIYEWGLWLNPNEWETKREWQYPLIITNPEADHDATPLKFQVTVSRFDSDAGFLAVYRPASDDTQEICERVFTRLQSVEPIIDYAQYQEKRLYEIEEGRLPTIRIRINEPLSTHHLAVIMSHCTQLFTKLWLTAQGRIVDLVEYTRTGNVAFSDEANLVIVDVTHKSPFRFDLNLGPIDPEKWAKAIQTIHDMLSLGKEVKAKQQLENQRLEQEIAQKDEEFAQACADRDQARAIKIQQDQLELKQRRLQYAKDFADFQFTRIERAIATATQLVELLYPHADAEKKAIAARSYLNDLLEITEITEGDFLLLAQPRDESDGEEKTR